MKSLTIRTGNALRGSRSSTAPAPVLHRDGSGVWTLSYAGAAQSLWQIWSRCDSSPVWSMSDELATSQFPATDDVMSPGGVWWQVKVCGEDSDGNPSTLFSNVISFGPVPS